jgi:hypothetical protein
MTTPAELKSAFLAAAQGKLTPSLLTYTADLDGDVINARIVVRDNISEDELETLFEILGDVVGHTRGTASFDLVRVPSATRAVLNGDLPIKLFRSSQLLPAG